LKIVAVLAKHGVGVLDQPILNPPAPDLADGDVFINETPPVRDALLFRGV
jgi:hypothetical protein